VDARAPLPRLLLIADGFASGRDGLEAEAVRQRAVALVAAGVPWVSLRDHSAPETTFQTGAAGLADALRRANPDVMLSVHGRLDAARALGAGVHCGRRGPAVGEAAGAGLAGPVGVSVHAPDEAERAVRGGAAYVTVSPVYATSTHPEAPALGIDALRRAVERAGAPVLALGGLTPPRARDARAVGAWGVAAISALLHAPDSAQAARQFLDALR
jgi:thiamine-phosphate pyrophosphorylase